MTSKQFYVEQRSQQSASETGRNRLLAVVPAGGGPRRSVGRAGEAVVDAVDELERGRECYARRAWMDAAHRLETRISDPTAGVRRALDRKGARYGSAPPYPLVIALAIEEPGVEDGDIAAALFGRAVMHILDTESDPMPVRHYREDDGYWSGRRNAGSRVSAVVTTRYPRRWSAATLEPHLWLNPWARRPYDGPRLWASTTVDARSGEFVSSVATVTTAGLLELPSDWPSSA